eukprot:scaffold4475_cov114-Isochrysis_galbana.AAC.4
MAWSPVAPALPRRAPPSQAYLPKGAGAARPPAPQSMDRTGDEDRVGGEGFSIQQVLFKVCPLGNPTPCPCIKCVPCCWDVVDADGMAEGMLRRHPAPAALPEKVRGVFWFKTNAAPELLFTLHGAGIDADARELRLTAFGAWEWSLNNTWVGCCELVACGLPSGRLRFQFDETWSFARMPITLCFCIPLPEGIARAVGMWYEMREVAEAAGKGETWERNTYKGTQKSPGSYKFVKVLDGNGRRLPAYDEMLASIEARELVGAWRSTIKTRQQMTKRCSPIGCGCC